MFKSPHLILLLQLCSFLLDFLRKSPLQVTLDLIDLSGRGQTEVLGG